MSKDQRVIRLYCDTGICITTEQYEEMIRELQIKKMTGTLTTGDSILVAVLHYMNYRYCEILHRRKLEAKQALTSGPGRLTEEL